MHYNISLNQRQGVVSKWTEKLSYFIALECVFNCLDLDLNTVSCVDACLMRDSVGFNTTYS